MNNEKVFTRDDARRIYDRLRGDSVVVPEGYTSIAGSAFYSCVLLKNVTLPDELKNIGPSAFQFCDALESVEIPASVTSIDSQAFLYCSNLKSVIFAEGSQLESVGSRAFYGCKSLESIELPASVRYIGVVAFPENTAVVHLKEKKPSLAERINNANERSALMSSGVSAPAKEDVQK